MSMGHAPDFPGRILFLSADPALLERQLAGDNLGVRDAGPLRDDISTDEITPLPSLIYFDGRLGEHAHTGTRAGDRFPIGVGALKAGGFSVLVAGKRYGKGSSREHSPVAEKAAGIRLVIAESFERIYRQNCDNIGLFTSSDFSLIDRIRAGETIPLGDLLKDRDTIAAAVLRAGGLLGYGQQKLRDLPATSASTAPHRPQTLFEKIVARHVIATPDSPARLAPGDGGFLRADIRFIHDIYTGMCRWMLNSAFAGRPVLHDPASILVFEDHFSYVHKSPVHVDKGLLPTVRGLSDAHRAFVGEHGLKHHGYLPDGEGSEGISHAMLAEHYALPGAVLVGTDSHTTHSGALGCVAFGVGTSDIANAFVTGAVRFRMPEVLRIEMTGAPPPGVTAKDIALHLLALPQIRAGLGVGKVFEFAGPGIAHLSTDERATLTNMTAELGGFTGIVAPDAETVRFLKERRGIDVALEDWMTSDAGAPYAAWIDIDLSALAPMVAAPGDPGNGLSLADVPPVRIDIAYGGSCTAGKREDFDQYHAVFAWAAARGLKPPPHVRLMLQFGTTAVRDYCIGQGYLAAFEAAGAEILQPACGACANCGPGVSTHSDQVTVSAINRNFPGRTGPGSVWLASPPTVAASAIAGELISFAALRQRHGDETLGA